MFTSLCSAFRQTREGREFFLVPVSPQLFLAQNNLCAYFEVVYSDTLHINLVR